MWSIILQAQTPKNYVTAIWKHLIWRNFHIIPGICSSSPALFLLFSDEFRYHHLKKKNLRRRVVPGSGNRSGALWYLLISLKLKILEFLSSLKRQYFLNENESLLKYFVEAQPVHFQEEKFLWITIPCSLLRAMSTSIRTEAGYSIWCLCLRGKQISKQCM